MSLEKNSFPRQRLEYGAVPLRPWQAIYPGTEVSYFEASRQHLEEKAQQAVTESPYLRDEERVQFGKFLTESLLATHANRVDYNHDSFETLNNLDDPCENLQYAYDGLATPRELTDILRTHPEIRALELAKLSHPLDFAATRAMDDEIIKTLENNNAKTLTTDTRYKRKRLRDDIPALIVVRKTELGDIAVDNGVIRVTQRQSLLVRGDVQPENVALARMVKNEQRFDELIEQIETYLRPENFDPSNQFVQPAATSYYAKYLERE